MGLRILKKLIPCVVAGSLLFNGTPGIEALAAEEEYPLVYEDLSEGEEPVAMLFCDMQSYTVLPGDSLWKIAEKLWGDGKGYLDLARENKELIKDPDVIFPGMVLTASRTGSIIRKEAKNGGVQMGDYSMDMPYGWGVGVIEMGNAFTNFAMIDDQTAIACLIQDRKKETGTSVRDWEQCKERITGYVSKNYEEQVSDLEFEHYRMEGQGGMSGDIYLYSFTWQVSPAYPGFTIPVCVGLKLTDHIQAEFVGYGMDYDIHGAVRYVSATFEEHFNPDNKEGFTVNDSNMQLTPEAEWEIDGMFNSFAWVDEFFTSLFNKALNTLGGEEEKSAREKLMEKMN